MVKKKQKQNNEIEVMGSVKALAVLQNPHPLIKDWIMNYKEMKHARSIPLQHGLHAADGFSKNDLYRFQVTSDLFHAVEESGGEVIEALITGKLKIRAGVVIDCVLSEKSSQVTVTNPDDSADTRRIYISRGFLYFDIKSYIPYTDQHRWNESGTRKLKGLIPKIVQTIMSAEENHKNHDEERRQQYEIYEEQRRVSQLDKDRWGAFKVLASDWDECKRIDRFIREVRLRSISEGHDATKTTKLEEWIYWLEQKRNKLDPFPRVFDSLFMNENRES